MKNIKIIALLIVCVILVSCNTPHIPLGLLNKTKPNNFYYTNLLAKNLTLEKNFKCIILDTNFYKEKELKKEDKIIIKEFIKSLNKKNFITKPNNLNKNPKYKIYFTFKSEKYIINVFNENIICIYPFDGEFSEDFLTIKNLPIAFNIYHLCNYMYNN